VSRYVYRIHTITTVLRAYDIVATDRDDAVAQLSQFNDRMVPVQMSSGPQMLDRTQIMARVPEPELEEEETELEEAPAA
jgi:hypothetical protein